MPIVSRFLAFFRADRRAAANPDQLSLFDAAGEATWREPPLPPARDEVPEPPPHDAPFVEAREPPPLEKLPLATLEQLARARCLSLWDIARRQYRVDARFTLTIDFDLRGRTVGKAIRNGDALKIRLNRVALEQNWPDMRDETIPHEIAHIVCFARPKFGRGHDAGWQSVCTALGGKGGRCYTNDTYQLPKARRTWRYTYRLDSGHTLALSHQHHRQVRAGAHIFVRKTREKIEPRHWTGDRELT